ncbi:hypothetical protein JOC74_002074 [Bacillus capparidis]|uniref:Uncharacterized protein n=1 Tax=Bacillus capparidis TaxID=1840411 RepID=A0ABS4CWU1_9BACI|nr:hypothetical protein [Bacillus capparidis]
MKQGMPFGTFIMSNGLFRKLSIVTIVMPPANL